MCGKMLSGSKSLISSYACIRMKDRPFDPPRHEEAAAITPADSEWRAESREQSRAERTDPLDVQSDRTPRRDRGAEPVGVRERKMQIRPRKGRFSAFPDRPFAGKKGGVDLPERVGDEQEPDRRRRPVERVSITFGVGAPPRRKRAEAARQIALGKSRNGGIIRCSASRSFSGS